MIKVAVVGATGYAGEELLKILVKHPEAEVISVTAKIERPQKISQIFPYLSGKLDLICTEPDFLKGVPDCELAFLALPHRVSMEIAPLFLRAGKKVIDLSADYRLKDIAVYEKWYGVKHKDAPNLTQAIYGLPEINRTQIKLARLVANPGCYPTGIILGCLPILKNNLAELSDIVADAKSGLSGAGRGKEAQLIPQMQENFRAYKVDEHQHAPEINQELSSFARGKVEVTFVPYLLPIKKGILSTIYFKLQKSISTRQAQALYQDFYRDEPFVKLLPRGDFPQLSDVAGTNFCHIGLKINSRQRLAIVVTAIDNLIKGASGQAVQNMNIMYGFKETQGLR